MEINLIIPAAGMSSRFNSGKPKWLRTHPDGKLMIEHAIDALVGSNYIINTYVITTKFINDEFNASQILRDTPIEKLKLIILKKETKSAVETILTGISSLGDEFNYNCFTILKDSDNFVKLKLNKDILNSNFTVGCDLNTTNVSRINNKSFLIVNDFDVVTDFVEKNVVSDKISVGTHGFKDFMIYIKEGERLLKKVSKELYNSQVISSLIYDKHIFKFLKAENYIDFGTQKEWNKVFLDFSTYFVDFDGTLVMNKGKYGDNNWSTLQDEPILDNIEIIKGFTEKGATVIITTSRSSKYSTYIKRFLKSYDLDVKHVICDLSHSPRIIINDFANTNPYPSCNAISIPRNSLIRSYFQYNF